MAAAAAETFLTGLSDTSEDDRLIRTSYNFYYFHERARGWLRWRELCAHIVQMREIISSLPALDDVRLIRALRAWMKTARARARHLELMTRALDHLAGEGKGDERGGGADHDAPASAGTKRAPGTTMTTRAQSDRHVFGTKYGLDWKMISCWRKLGSTAVASAARKAKRKKEST